jgi:hypothetical protein
MLTSFVCTSLCSFRFAEFRSRDFITNHPMDKLTYKDARAQYTRSTDDERETTDVERALSATPFVWATTHSSNNSMLASPKREELNTDGDAVEELFEYLATPGETLADARPLIAVTSVDAPYRPHLAREDNVPTRRRSNMIPSVQNDDEFVVFRALSLRPELSPEPTAHNQIALSLSPTLPASSIAPTIALEEQAVRRKEHAARKFATSSHSAVSLRPVLSPDPKQTEQPTAAETDDRVTDDIGGAREPTSLSSFLARLHLSSFEAGLRDMGADVPVDLTLLDDSDCVGLGMKKLQKRKLEAALGELAAVRVNESVGATPAEGQRLLAYL